VGLLGPADIRNKAQPAVSTDAATAAGKMNAPRSLSRQPPVAASNNDRKRGVERSINNRAVHNYGGNDPTVLRLLDTVFVDKFRSTRPTLALSLSRAADRFRRILCNLHLDFGDRKGSSWAFLASIPRG